MLRKDLTLDQHDKFKDVFINNLIDIKSYNKKENQRIKYLDDVNSCLQFYEGVYKSNLISILKLINHIVDSNDQILKTYF